MTFSFRNTLLAAACTVAAACGPAACFAESKVALTSPVPNTGSQLSLEEADKSLFLLDDKMLSELLLQNLTEAMAEFELLQNVLAEALQNAPMKPSFKSKAEYAAYASAMSEWERLINELEAELERLEEEINTLIIFTTSTDHLKSLSGTDLGNGR